MNCVGARSLEGPYLQISQYMFSSCILAISIKEQYKDDGGY
jgi:hypothetical protein